jgi:hypothetical protein
MEVDEAFRRKLLADGSLEVTDGSSGWSSICFYILKDKKDPVLASPGEVGFDDECVKKYRRVVDLVVNPYVVPDVSPVPNLWITAKESSGYDYYVILDWKDAYHQLVLALASRAFTTHGCGGKLARYAGVPQGLVGAAQRMQRCAEAVFGHIKNCVCLR